MPNVYWVGAFIIDTLNIGDQAQYYAVKKFLKEKFDDYNILQYGDEKMEMFFHHVNVEKDDIILIQSGGSFGDLYPNLHNLRKRIITNYPDNLIIQLPISVHYNNIKSFEADKEFFANKFNLTILCRSKKSAEFLANNFSCKVAHFPDFTYYIRPKLRNYRRKGVLFVLRSDSESTFETKLSQTVRKVRHPLKDIGKVIHKDLYYIMVKYIRKVDKHLIESFIREKVKGAVISDVQVAKQPITDENREKVIMELLDYYQHFECVVTDRYHALVFGAITHTPTSVIPNMIKGKTESPNIRYPHEIFNSFREKYVDKSKSIIQAV